MKLLHCFAMFGCVCFVSCGTSTTAPFKFVEPEFVLVIPDDVPRELTLHHKGGETEVVNGRAMYELAYREGWQECCDKFQKLEEPEPPVEGFPKFTDDLDIPFRQEFGISQRGRRDGYTQCEQAISQMSVKQ